MLALEAQRENQAMQSLTMKGTRDAAAVKVLTVVTLVYLPTTAVLVCPFLTHLAFQRIDTSWRISSRLHLWTLAETAMVHPCSQLPGTGGLLWP
jgi:hypothetical protein